jgi:hypothetical protein
MEHWWNDNDTGKPKYAKIKITILLHKDLSQCHFTTINSARTSSELKLGLCSKKMMTGYPNHGTVLNVVTYLLTSFGTVYIYSCDKVNC